MAVATASTASRLEGSRSAVSVGQVVYNSLPMTVDSLRKRREDRRRNGVFYVVDCCTLSDDTDKLVNTRLGKFRKYPNLRFHVASLVMLYS